MSTTTSDGKITPGYKTTEFWLTVLTGASSLVAGLQGMLPEKWAAISTAIVTAAYSIARAMTKKAGIEATEK